MDNFTSSITNTNDPSLRAHTIQQLGFMTALSEDTIIEIFAYLEQQDCLTTMAVCRHWYRSTPRFAHESLTALRISPRHIENQRLFLCLGDHVKHIVVEKFKKEQELCHIIRKLFEHGCTKVKSLELNGCATAADQDVFLRVFEKLSAHVTHLKILRHDSNIAFLHVLNACPQLIHFTYQAKQGIHESHTNEPVVVDSSVDTFPTITHLCLDVVLDRQLRLNPILRRCPNLRYFVGANLRRKKFFDHIAYNELSVDFDLLFEWCPKISYIENTFGYSFIPNIDDIVFDDTAGLRHLSICQVYQPETVVQHLASSQHSLDFLSIRRHGHNSDGIDWFSVLRNMQLSRLRTLVFGKLGLNAESIVIVINNCPALEKLVLYDALTITRSAVRHLNWIKQLRTLSLREVSLGYGVSLVNLLNKFPALEKLAMFHSTIQLILPEGSQLPRNLKELDLRHIEWKLYDDNANIKEAIVQLFHCFATYSKLQFITFSELPFFNIESLSSTIAIIPTLKSLTVQINEAQCTRAEEDGLCQFASLLKKTVVEELYMETYWHLPPKILCKFRELSLLVHHVSHRISILPCTLCSIPRKNVQTYTD